MTEFTGTRKQCGNYSAQTGFILAQFNYNTLANNPDAYALMAGRDRMHPEFKILDLEILWVESIIHLGINKFKSWIHKSQFYLQGKLVSSIQMIALLQKIVWYEIYHSYLCTLTYTTRHMSYTITGFDTQWYFYLFVCTCKHLINIFGLLGLLTLFLSS